jgi:hypothetical protein
VQSINNRIKFASYYRKAKDARKASCKKENKQGYNSATSVAAATKIRRTRLIRGFSSDSYTLIGHQQQTTAVVAPDRGAPVYYKIDGPCCGAGDLSFAGQLGVEAAQADRERLEG